ncbi:MAG TPA: SUMF1/EgtB/PvdO family nonheme iron enzyme, partial [Polyangiaceae bacterium]|nr:SUMF1/EgtB/PvdO family nonheme iron enzyme [Polyangiaceae bacterium]
AAAPSAQSGVCAWNVAAADAGAPPASGPAPGFAINDTCLGSTPVETLPVTCVDWCDAQAFCLWAGKELCGDSTTALDDAAQSDWYAVCSANGGNEYPYGANYKGDACNGADANKASPAAPGTFTACSTAASVFDLTGNVSEWTGACSQNTEDGPCQVRGGSYGSSAQQLECAHAEVITRKQTAPTRGFRCCHE